MYYFSISIVIIANVLYSLFQNMIPGEINPVVALFCMYIGGSLCAIPFYLKNKGKYKVNISEIGKRALLFGIINIVIDLGFLCAFRFGWDLGYFNIISNISILLVLTITGIVFYKEKISLLNILGVILGIIGLSILNV